VLLDGAVVVFLVGFGRLVVTWGLFVVAFCDVFGLEGFGVVTLMGRVGFSDDTGFWVTRIGLFVVADGLFVVADDNDGLVVGFRVGFFVVFPLVLPLVGFLVTLEDIVEVSTVLFRV